MSAHSSEIWRLPGVSSTVEDDRESEIKLFTLWSEGVPPPYATLDQTGDIDTRSVCRAVRNPHRWWIVTLSATEVVRTTDEALAPLTRGELLRSPGVLRSSRLRARIGWGRAGQGHYVDLDIGSGVRLAINSCEVDVRVAGPQGRMREVSKGETRTLGTAGEGGVYLDTLLSATIQPSHGAPPSRSPTLTQVVAIAPGIADFPIVVPPFARRLSVSRVGLFAAGPVFFRVGVFGPPLRVVTLDPLDPNNSSSVLVPQSATHVTTGPAVLVPRTLTFQWELDV